jgi:predicted transglutaminase-like cysteine proteinase
MRDARSNAGERAGSAGRPRQPASFRIRSCVAFVLCLGLAAAAPKVAAETPPQLFGTTEIRNDDLAVFTKWTGMLDRMRQTPEPFVDQCELPQAGRCHLKEWNAYLDGIKDRSKRDQLDAVNATMNRFPYIEDIVNWGVKEYWETPLEFLFKSGNCKDYAIAKYMSLRYLGWPVDALRVVVLRDLNLQLDHAVVAAYLDDQIYVLDNQINTVVNASSIHHYRPYYSINEEHWWLHR